MFDWPSQSGAGLSVIGISNTHDLDSRVLPRIASRLSSSKLAFAPYSAAQLVAIVKDRLAGSALVPDTSVEFAARKVSLRVCLLYACMPWVVSMLSCTAVVAALLVWQRRQRTVFERVRCRQQPGAPLVPGLQFNPSIPS